LGYLVEEGFVAKPEGRPHGLLAMNN